MKVMNKIGYMLEDRGCKYCNQTFASRTEKLSNKKYMCKPYKIAYSHSVELHINSQKYILYGECNSKSNKTGSSPL